ncbi:MAG TPA: hypothetical protein VHE81_04395, partial [Lacipirellulaceae bacterium]|nr:hypothetical protein [Lacipirellulaceae bacterium]
MAADDKSSHRGHPNGRHRGRYAKPGGRPHRVESTRGHASKPEPAGPTSGYRARGAWQVREVVRGHEGTAVVVALVAGFGVGVLIGG